MVDGMRDALKLSSECLARSVPTSASPAGRVHAGELAAHDRALSQRPATEVAWHTLLARIDDHLLSIGIAFREVEESVVAGEEETAAGTPWTTV